MITIFERGIINNIGFYLHYLIKMEKTLITSADTIISPVSTANSSPGEETPSIKKRTLDEFSMLNTLGQGAYGTVRLGKDKLTDKMVAVKCVNKELI